MGKEGREPKEGINNKNDAINELNLKGHCPFLGQCPDFVLEKFDGLSPSKRVELVSSIGYDNCIQCIDEWYENNNPPQDCIEGYNTFTIGTVTGNYHTIHDEIDGIMDRLIPVEIIVNRKLRKRKGLRRKRHICGGLRM